MAPPEMCVSWVEIETGDSEGAKTGSAVVIGPLPPVRVRVRTTVDEGDITVDVPRIMPGVSETHAVVPGAIHVPFTMAVALTIRVVPETTSVLPP